MEEDLKVWTVNWRSVGIEDLITVESTDIYTAKKIASRELLKRHKDEDFFENLSVSRCVAASKVRLDDGIELGRVLE